MKLCQCYLKSNSICKSAFFHLRNISRIRKYQSRTATERLIHAFVTIKLDSYNSLLYGLPKYCIQKLQSVLNAAASLLTYASKYDHITPLLAELHWLPVEKRIIFKILLLTYKALYSPPPVHSFSSNINTISRTTVTVDFKSLHPASGTVSLKASSPPRLSTSLNPNWKLTYTNNLKLNFFFILRSKIVVIHSFTCIFRLYSLLLFSFNFIKLVTIVKRIER